MLNIFYYSYLFAFLVISLDEILKIYGPKGMNIFKAVDPYCQVIFK